MQRSYKRLGQQSFLKGGYALVPIRDGDKYSIMQWRNDQIDVLRQKEPLTREQQEAYFRNVVDKLFSAEMPDQLLFSFLENDVLIGYGGLVHIDWESKNGEISFLSATERSRDPDLFKTDWSSYLDLLKEMARIQLGFTKIYTYAYDIRPHLFQVLLENDFVEEARLSEHVMIKAKPYDVLIHSYFIDTLTWRIATEADVMLYFEWANDELVRQNSFNPEPIELEGHKKWFARKVNDPNSLMLVAEIQGDPVGQIRFDPIGHDSFQIGFSVARKYRGKGLGSKLLRTGTQTLLKKKPGGRVIGQIKRSNSASRKTFIKAGFKPFVSSDSPNEIDSYYFDKRSIN